MNHQPSLGLLLTCCVWVSAASPARAESVTRLYRDIAIAPDGRRMAVVEAVVIDDDEVLSAKQLRTNIIVANVDGTNAVVVDSVPSCTGAISDIAWGPQSDSLTYVRVRVNTTFGESWEPAREYRLRVLNADGSFGRTVLRSERPISGPVMTQDGQSIIYRVEPAAVPASLKLDLLGTGNKDGTSKPSLRIVGTGGENDRELVREELEPGRARRVDRAGELILFPSRAINTDGSPNAAETRRVINAIRADGSGLTQAVTWPNADPVSVTDIACSASTSRILVTARQGSQETHVWQVCGLAERTVEVLSPSSRGAYGVSPDGSYAMFCAGESRFTSLTRVDVDGASRDITLQMTDPGEVFWTSSEDEPEGEEGGQPDGTEAMTFGDVAMSPDGGHVVFTWRTADAQNTDSGLWSMRYNGTDLVQLTDSALDAQPRFSPDGTRVVFTRAAGADPGAQRDIYTVTTDGHKIEPLIATDDDEYEPAFGEDATVVLFRRDPVGRPEDGRILSSSGGKETEVAGAGFDATNPVCLPGLGATVFSSRAIGADSKPVDGNRHLGAVTAAAPRPASWRTSTGTPADLMAFRASNDGSRTLTVMRAEGKDYMFHEEKSLVQNAAGVVSAIESFRSLDLAADGSRFAFVGTVGDRKDEGEGLWVVDWESAKFARINPGEQNLDLEPMPQPFSWTSLANADGLDEPMSRGQLGASRCVPECTWPAISPDGARIAVVETALDAGSVPVRDATLSVANLDGTGVQDIATASSIRRPRWNALGTRVVFEMTPVGETDSEVFVAGADGSDLTRITTNDVDDAEPAFTWDDTGIVFVRRPSAAAPGELLRVDRDGTNEAVLLPSDFDPAYPVAWKAAKSLAVRTLPADNGGARTPGVPGWMYAALVDGKPLPMAMGMPGASAWPQSIRIASEGPMSVIRIAKDKESPGRLLSVNEGDAAALSSHVEQCIVWSDQLDMTGDAKTIAFFGTRSESDPAERPGLWIMNMDGTGARYFTLKR